MSVMELVYDALLYPRETKCVFISYHALMLVKAYQQ